jgi:hypothetical protein
VEYASKVTVMNSAYTHCFTSRRHRNIVEVYAIFQVTPAVTSSSATLHVPLSYSSGIQPGVREDILGGT